ncbi:tyrosine recombinase XerS [Lactococcus ileimucosae]|uniref:Tyrosine recombinase XerS n=1 Tax=Lactococcus ileimucosae TaxID=2941329 RepID=A0ABV4D329_9LACT
MTKNVQNKIGSLLEAMPKYVQEFYHSKASVPYSPNTLLAYLEEYQRFFSWLIDSDAISGTKSITQISLDSLAKLPKADVESYIMFLRTKEKGNGQEKHKKYGISQVSINRAISALSSLFNYLTVESEDENGEPYFDRNVMKRIKVKAKTRSLSARAEAMKPKLFLGDETQAFLDFIQEDYPKTLKARALTSYNQNVERDLAMIALFLSTGIRLSELVNTNLKDLNLNTMTIEVMRKGGFVDSVNIAPFAKPYLENYLAIREQRYKAEKHNIELFLTNYRQEAKRIGASSVEALVSKYSAAFKIRVTPHKLRHTLATRLYAETKSPNLVANQLGHTSNSTVTSQYISVLSDEAKDGLAEL